jgi:hypothetical protein
MSTAPGVPLAYLITFHTYGTWLPGDPGGSVDAHHNAPGTPYLDASQPRADASAQHMKQAPVLLSDAERAVVARTAQEVCHHRRWLLRAVHARTNHVHAVIWAQHAPERVMNDLKAWATRRLVEAGLRPQGSRIWVRHGSTRYLWSQEAADAACAYVLDGQGGGWAGAAW